MTNDDDILPYDDDSYDPTAPQKPGQAVLGLDFAYIGRALTIAEFTAYLAGYNFGAVPPDSVCLHHTAIPTLPQWIANEAGMIEAQIRSKRLSRLAGLRDFYAGLGWPCGPHLFIDDKFIYLFTPMNQVGIHAKWGNSFRSMGRLHYSIGIEVIGDYSREVWSTAVAANVRGAVLALHDRLRTFELKYLYSDRATKPGMIGVGEAQKCAHPERLRSGGIASHRDFNKPACPGAAIGEAYYMGVIIADAPPGPSHPLPVPPLVHFVVKAACTGGASIRAYPSTNAAILGRLHAGDPWTGEAYEANSSTFVKGFGSSKVWVRSLDMRYVWAGLLEEVKES